MQSDVSRRRWSFCAKVLFFFSITLFVWGIVLQKNSSLMDPVKDVEPISQDSSTITISTSDGSEVVPGNIIIGEGKPGIPDETHISQKNVGDNYVPTLEETNSIFRDTIQETYHISVRYGDETKGYKVAGVETTPITDADVVQKQLQYLNETLQLYPQGMFEEIKNGGIPLTIILIDHYSEELITGVTDSSYSYAVISIAAAYSFRESFYHESYHYIERYLLKKGVTFSSWKSLNPAGFQYNRDINDNTLSYDRTFSEKASFVNNYAQSAPEEDRASTFEYMMAENKASCLNYGNPVWMKANYMAMNIDTVLDTVRPDVKEYWERFLD